MDNTNELREQELDEILDQLQDLPEAEETEVPEFEDLAEELEMLDHLLEELPELPEVKIEALSVDSIRLDSVTPAGEKSAPDLSADTIRFEAISVKKNEDADEEKAVPTDDTQRIDVDQATAMAEENKAEQKKVDFISPPPIVFTPQARLRELKKKLVAGPEKRYYELSEIGVGRLQLAIIMNLILVGICAVCTTLFAMGLIPDNRLRLMIFSQILAMLLSALMGCHQILDGIGDIFKGRFTINSLLFFTFGACCADAVFCLTELRIPCCAAFSLEITMALWARYQRRTTEMQQMDTMRKAVRLRSLVEVPDYFEKRSGILKDEGRVEDFMDNYAVPSGPEKVQNLYALLSLPVCIGIAVFAGMMHGLSMGLQILSTSLLVAVPASFFVSVTRPAAILERRLHMVGTVLCGWKGVKRLCRKVAFPLKDEDIFPNGSAKLNGVKFYGDRKPEEALTYSTSLICASGSGLAPVFRQMLANRGGKEHKVENFRNYGGGGIGGEVCGEPVLLGTLHFLQDMGVEIPEGTMVNQAIYVSIDGQLSAVFAISYAKMRSAAAGLVTLCSRRQIKPVMIGGDFMLTDSLLRAKFSVNTRRIAFPSREVRSELAARLPDPEAPALALVTREDLVSAAYAVSGAKALRTATNLGVAIHLVGGILGMLIMLALAYLGTTELLTPTHVLLYQLVWLVPGLLITEWTRTV